MIRFIIKIACKTDNFLYRLIGYLAIIENGGIHPKHRILNYHKFFVDNISENDSVLDIGCGNGAVAYDIAEKAERVIGIDISQKNTETAKKRFGKENLKYVTGDATKYDFTEKFDIIILSNVLEHIKDRVIFLKNMKRLAPKILIRVPLITRDWISVWKRDNGFSYKLDDTHFTEYTEETFQEEMEKAGLKIESSHVKFGELYSVISNPL